MLKILVLLVMLMTLSGCPSLYLTGLEHDISVHYDRERGGWYNSSDGGMNESGGWGAGTKFKFIYGVNR